MIEYQILLMHEKSLSDQYKYKNDDIIKKINCKINVLQHFVHKSEITYIKSENELHCLQCKNN